mgnify:CR=1 FL=1
MKKTIFTLFAVIVCSFSFGQQIFIYFEPDNLYNADYKKYFYIDSNNIDNIWQVGTPNKTIFDSAYTVPNALVTDTINTYPINNTSSVMFWNIVSLCACDVSFRYKINSDTLLDYGKVEVSGNGGLTWTEITSYWIGPPPVFSGNSKGWKSAFFEFGPTELFNSQLGDTILFKFTFTSDGIETHKDGWMIDDIIIMWTTGIGISETTNKQNLFQISYQGNNEIELIRRENEDPGNHQIQFFDIHGKQIYTNSIENKKRNIYRLPDIVKGIYLYTISSENQLKQSGKIAIIR